MTKYTKTPVVVGVLAGMILGCAAADPTDAERGALVGDVTSCARVQAPVGTCPGIVCSKPVEECAIAGCAIAGDGLVLYPDWSWADPKPGAGAWSFDYAYGLEIVSLGDGRRLQVNVTPGIPIPGCQ